MDPLSDRADRHALAYNVGNFMRTLATPKAAEPWSLTSLREKLIKIGAIVVSHRRYVTFQMAEVSVSRQMLADILSLISRLREPPAAAMRANASHDERIGMPRCEQSIAVQRSGAANRPLGPRFAGTRRDCGLPVPLKRCDSASQPPGIWRMSD
jgi:hypothetical protein